MLVYVFSPFGPTSKNCYAFSTRITAAVVGVLWRSGHGGRNLGGAERDRLGVASLREQHRAGAVEADGDGVAPAGEPRYRSLFVLFFFVLITVYTTGRRVPL